MTAVKRILMSSAAIAATVLAMIPVAAQTPETAEPIESGITVKDETSPTGYTAKFAFDPASDVSGKEIEKVEVKGVFNYLSPELHVLDEANRYTPDEWENGYYPSTSAPGPGLSGYEEEMVKGEDGIYTASFPIGSGAYGYSFRITYTDGTIVEKIEDPANPANALGKVNQGNKRHSSDINSSIIFGHWDAEKQSKSPNWDAVLPSATYGKLEYVSYVDAVGQDNYMGVYTPAGYDPERTEPYKTIYLSHGGGGDESDWFHMGNADYVLQNTINAGETEEAIIVTMDNMIYGFDPVGMGSYQGFNKDVVEDNILNVIKPLIEENYNVSEEANDRAYIGLSFGGRSAADMFWDHPEEFGYYGCLSCASWVVDENGENIHPMIDAYKVPEMFVCCGAADFANGDIATPDTFPSMLPQPFAKWCKENIPDTYHESSEYGLVYPGSHDWFTWPAAFETMLKEVLWIKDDAEITDPVVPAKVESGIAVKDETSPTGYTAKFAYDPANDTTGKKIVKVEVNGTFNYLNPEQDVLEETNRYSPDEWQNGFYASNSAPGVGVYGQTKEMTLDEETGLFTVTMPIASGSYGYSFRITYEDGSVEEKIEDPANPANVNGKVNQADKRHSSDINSSILYGHWDAEKQSESPNLDFVLPAENYGHLSFDEYVAADGLVNSIGVYTPAGYDADRGEPYKVIFMSHGGGGDESDWFHMGNADNVLQNTIDAGLTQEAIIVTMDNMYFGFDPVGFSGYQGFNKDVVEDNILNHILPYMEENYNISSEPADRAYIGLSFGGRSAADMFWDCPEEFGYYGMLSCGSWVLDENGENIHPMIDAYNGPELFVSVGTADFCNAEIATPDTFPSMLPQPFAAWCRENIPDHYHESDYGLKVPGSHDWFMWSISFENMLREVLWINDTVEEEPDPVTPVTPVNPEKPSTGVDTGDSFNAGIFGGLIAACAGLAAAAWFALKKRA